MGRTPLFLATMLCICFVTAAASAQKPPAAAIPVKDTAPPSSPEQAIDDPLGRSTPYGSVLGFMKAMDRDDVERATEYLDTKQPPRRAQELARHLQFVLDRGLSGSLTALSKKPEGGLEDGLRPNRERVGLIKTAGGSYDIQLERVQRGGDPPVWLFSSDTLKQVPEIYDELEVYWLEKYLPTWLRESRIFGQLTWRWVIILLVLPGSFLLGWLVAWLIIPPLRLIFRGLRRRQPEGALVGLKGPIRMLAVALGFYCASLVSYSLLTRLFWGRVAATLGVLGLTWLCLRLVDPLMELWSARRQAPISSGTIAIRRLGRKLVKVLVVVAAAVSVFYMAGINLTAVLTGLGVGGIAIAFAAQKTLENLFGGIMIVSDRPIRVGDFCKAGDYTGTVEDIGLRSTRLRTLARTMVFVPNGQLSTMSLENFTMRDKILFNHKLQLRYDTTSDQIQFVIGETRRMLAEHTAVEKESARVRFSGLKEWGLEVEVYAYILETDYAIFLETQEKLLLGIMKAIEASGTGFGVAPTPALSGNLPPRT